MLPILMMDRKEKENSCKSLNDRNNPSYSQNLIFNTMRGLRSWLMKSTVIHLKFLSYEMTLYPTEQGCVLGTEGDLLVRLV